MLTDWRYRTIGLHDFTTQQGDLAGLRADRRPPDGGDPDRLRAGVPHRGRRRATRQLLDIAPTVLHLLGVPVPGDMDGRVLTELLEPMAAQSAAVPDAGTCFCRRQANGGFSVAR